MKIVLVCVGRTQSGPVQDCIFKYVKRIPHYVPFELKEIPDIKSTKSLTEARQREMEGQNILAQVSAADFLMLLDERGREFSSKEFAVFLSDKMVNLPGRLVFVVGGPYGFSPEVYARADAKLSLSKMTFPHDLVRVFFVEQIYRAMTILRGEPYHHD